jgi:subtilisin family serine protease
MRVPRHNALYAAVLCLISTAAADNPAGNSAGRGIIVSTKQNVMSLNLNIDTGIMDHPQQLDDSTFLVRCKKSVKKCLQRIEEDPNVDFAELDMEVKVEPLDMSIFSGVNSSVSVPTIGCKGGTYDIPVTSWGLDRIDGKLDGVVKRPKSPRRNKVTLTGEDTYVYVLDTGVFGEHIEFCDRVRPGVAFIDINESTRGNIDCNGHGTHVASTVAGASLGVAPKATIVPVRVLNCAGSGSVAGVIQGLNWAVKHVPPKRKSRKRAKIINMSLGGGVSRAMDEAVKRATDSGAIVVVAAGNNYGNACFRSPSGAESAIVVGATTNADSASRYSNIGKCVDILAPGSGINGASIRSRTANVFLSGTSMAAPHVAGVLALMAERTPRKDARGLERELLSRWTEKNAIARTGVETPNLFLNNHKKNRQLITVSP